MTNRWRVVGWASVATISACTGASHGKDGTTDTGRPGEQVAPIFINELMASNATTLADETGAFPDWLELYNPNDAAVDLGGWWMSDDPTYPFRWQFPSPTVLEPGGYLTLFCDHDPEQGPDHTGFSLSAAAGSDVGLFGPNTLGNPVVDEVEDMEAATPDVSLSRESDGSPTWVADATPTPGAAND